MYIGNLIDELFATVESAEARIHERDRRMAGEPAELERWYVRLHEPEVQPFQQRVEQNLLGVA